MRRRTCRRLASTNLSDDHRALSFRDITHRSAVIGSHRLVEAEQLGLSVVHDHDADRSWVDVEAEAIIGRLAEHGQIAAMTSAWLTSMTDLPENLWRSSSMQPHILRRTSSLPSPIGVTATARVCFSDARRGRRSQREGPISQAAETACLPIGELLLRRRLHEIAGLAFQRAAIPRASASLAQRIASITTPTELGGSYAC
jgi:hypothetical protein